MADLPRKWCARCAREVDIRYRYPGWLRRGLIGYLCIPIAIVPTIPFLAGDYVVSLPLMMVYMLGIGPVLSIVREQPTCSDCGALVSSKSKSPLPSQA